MKECRVCGKLHRGDFCPRCGYLESRDVICPRCGKSFDPDFDRCPYCGYTEPVDSSEVVLSSGYDANKEKTYVKCVNVYIQKVVLSCIAFCLFLALFVIMFAGFLRISPERRIVAYIVLTVVFAALLCTAVIVHVARVFSAKNRGIKNLEHSYLLTGVYVFIGIIGACFVCGCVFWISDLASTIGKFHLYGFIVYSALSLAGVLYGVRVIFSVRKLRAILFGSDDYLGEPLRIADENLSPKSYVYYLEYKRKTKKARSAVYDSIDISGGYEKAVKTKRCLTIRAKILCTAILVVVLMAVIIFFVIRGAGSLFNVERLVGGFYQGSICEYTQEFLDYDIDYYIDILGTPDKETESALYWYNDTDKETCNFIMVTFDGESEERNVTSVLFDSKHIYSETDDFSTCEKAVYDLALTNNSYEFHYFEGQNVNVYDLNTDNEPVYAVEYTDGSFYVSYLHEFTVNDVDEHSEIEWTDVLGTYSADASLILRSQTDENGVLKYWYVDDGILDIPDWVVSIAGDALNGVTYINELSLPNTVKSITIPSSVTSIDCDVFKNCESLESVTLNGGTTSKEMFSGCTSLVNLSIGGAVKEIADYSFCSLSSLESVTIGDGVIAIGSSAFMGCSSLACVKIGEGVTSIGSSAFKNCTSISDVYIDDIAFWCSIRFADIDSNPLSMSDNLYIGDEPVSGSLTIPEGVTYVSTYAFYGCELITGVNFSNTVTSVDSYAFCNCTELLDLNLSDSVVAIAENAFYGCTSLSSVTIGAGVTVIGDDAFGNCESLAKVYISDVSSWCGIEFESVTSNPLSYECDLYLNGILLTDLAIPDSVTSVGPYAFYGCKSLVSISISENITSIGDYAFFDCTYVEDIYFDATMMNDFAPDNNIFSLLGINGEGIRLTIGSETVKIPAYLFCPCDAASSAPKITSVLFTESSQCTSIGEYAFYGCASLSSVAIGTEVTVIGNNAFGECNSLGIVYIGDVSSWCGIAFESVASNPLSYECDLYLNGTLLCDLVIPDSVTSIGTYAFYGCRSIVSISISENITSIGDYAFFDCTYVEDIYFNAAMMNDFAPNNNVFSLLGANGEGINLTIGSEATKIPAYLFCPCDAVSCTPLITSVLFDESSQCGSIGKYAFYGCSTLKSLAIPQGIVSIGEYAFYECIGLEAIYYDVKSLDDLSSTNRMFYMAGQNGDGITVTIGADVTKIPAYLFYSYDASAASKIIDVIFEDGCKCTSIGAYAFAYCDLLTSIVIPDTVTSGIDNTFYGCSSLTDVTIGSGVTSITEGSFYGCSSIEKMTIPFVGGSSSSTSASSTTLFGYIFGSVRYTGSTSTKQYYKSSSYATYYIPSGLKSVTITGKRILYGSFYGCTSLEDVTISENVSSIGDYAFYNCSALTEIHFNAKSVSNFSSSNRTFENAGQSGSGIAITIGPSVTKIPAYFCYTYTASYQSYTPPKITSVVFEEGSVCTSIGDHAFDSCSEIETMILSDSITSIGAEAFSDCTKLSSINIPSAVTSIGRYAFSECNSMMNVVIPDGVTTINDGTFVNCYRLTSMVIPDNVTYIGVMAFWQCFSLTNVTIGSAVKTIDTFAFENCHSLIEIYNRSTLSISAGSSSNGYVGYYAKSVYTPSSGASKITTTDDGFIFYSGSSYCLVGYSGSESDLKLPDDGEDYEIYDYAFWYCTFLKSVTIPDSVTSIGNWAFYYCSSLSTVYYCGDSQDWSSISISSSGNSTLTSATRFYFSESEPTTSGNYWHYDENGNPIIW